MQPDQQPGFPSAQTPQPAGPSAAATPKLKNTSSRREFLILGTLLVLMIIAAGVLVFIFIAIPQYKRLQAQTLSNQVFTDVMDNDGRDIYQRLNPADKRWATEAGMTSYIQKTRQLITHTSSKTSVASYPAKDYAQFVYTVQTANGPEPLVIQLKRIDKRWTVYTVILNPKS